MIRRLVFVVGTRAQLIKVAPVLVACERQRLPVHLLLTGQHAETMDDLLLEFGVTCPAEHAIPPGEHATIRSLASWLPHAWRGIRSALKHMRAEGAKLDVVVHGDTLSAALGALAARSVKSRVLHLESGLTSRCWYDPFPEELVRRLVFRTTDVAFCPGADPSAFMLQNYRCDVVDTNTNTVADAVALSGVRRAKGSPPRIVVSLHRFQNIYRLRRLRSLVETVSALADIFTITFVLHPATRKRLVAHGLFAKLESIPNVTLSPRLSYSAFLALAAAAECVLTDGGSNQEELAVLGVPTILMRPRSERKDGIGSNAIFEADVPGGIVQFLRAGGASSLESAGKTEEHASPSELIAAHLMLEYSKQAPPRG